MNGSRPVRVVTKELRRVRLSQPIRRIGPYEVPIQFDKDLRTDITITIDPDRALELEMAEQDEEEGAEGAEKAEGDGGEAGGAEATSEEKAEASA